MIDRSGTDLAFFNNLGLPIEQSLSLDSREALNMISPLLKFPIERVTNKNIFFDKDITEVTDASAFRFAPQFLKDFIGFTEDEIDPKEGDSFTLYKSTQPRNMHLLLNFPLSSRIWSVIKQVTDPRFTPTQKVIKQTTGVQPVKFNIELERKKRDQELLKELQQLLINAGVGAEFTKFFIPKETGGGISGI